jgi:hypothetical protein
MKLVFGLSQGSIQNSTDILKQISSLHNQFRKHKIEINLSISSNIKITSLILHALEKLETEIKSYKWK